MKVIDKKKLTDTLSKNKFLLLALAAGVLLLLLPIGGKEKDAEQSAANEPAFSLKYEEERLAKQLGKIKGAGRVSVLLSVHKGSSRELAVSGDETLIISSGSGKGEEVVELYYVNPEYAGAVIVCDGASSSSSVRLGIIRATASFTGLSTDSIQVIQME